MPMNLTRTGSAAVVGVASGVLENQVEALDLGGNRVSWGTIVEALAVVGGSVAQFVMPYSFPHVVDGLVDGGIALLGRRGAEYAAGQVGARGAIGAQLIAPQYSAPSYDIPALFDPEVMSPALPEPSYARGAIGAVSRVPRVSLT